jgi:L-seryl-tRNA(Ser) seleniumtransferase
LKSLPAVHELADELDAPHALAVTAARRAIEARRTALLKGASGGGDLLAEARAALDELRRPSLRQLINATGVIVHTNLGRAPLARPARDAVGRIAAGYSNLELDLDTGRRSARHVHVEELLCELTGAEAAVAVNNGAAAVLLAVAALAGPARSIVVSRGQLVEIGGGFRIPEVIAQSGAQLVEVGTTNRTRLRDYERALVSVDQHAPAGAILRVHQSNFRAVGFVEDVPIEALCGLGVSVIDDVGSGALASDVAALDDEPAIARSVAAGAALVCCSGDKLLGGPQAGLIVGQATAIAAARAHPLARAVRIDKLSLAALEATLMIYRDPESARAEIPVLAMLDATEDELASRAARLKAAVGARATVVRASAKVGGGALPLLELDGPVVAIDDTDPDRLAAALRGSDPPVLARINDGRLLLDPRTLAEDQVSLVASAVVQALG